MVFRNYYKVDSSLTAKFKKKKDPQHHLEHALQIAVDTHCSTSLLTTSSIR